MTREHCWVKYASGTVVYYHKHSYSSVFPNFGYRESVRNDFDTCDLKLLRTLKRTYLNTYV